MTAKTFNKTPVSMEEVNHSLMVFKAESVLFMLKAMEHEYWAEDNIMRRVCDALRLQTKKLAGAIPFSSKETIDSEIKNAINAINEEVSKMFFFTM